MIERHKLVALCTWALCVLFGATLVRAGEPTITVNRFQNLPARIFFFDDSSTLVYHDVVQGNVYISNDEGKKWDRVSDIPAGDASMVFEHPFDNRIAYTLTKGNKHWRTEDRGKSWRPFEVPIPPAWVANPLSFHSDPANHGYVLYQGTRCDRAGWGAVCSDETYYTTDGFAHTNKLLSQTSRCQFAHSRKEFKHDAHKDLIYCVAFDTESQDGAHSLASSRVFSSTDFFNKENRVEDFGIGKNARGVVAFAIVSKFAVVALKDMSPGNNGEMLLYVTVDTKNWAKAEFPHASSARLRENAYTIVESTTHSLGVDVVLDNHRTIGTLFVSNSNGTYFVESLAGTNRNDAGFVDFENIYGIEGVGIANTVGNAQEVESRSAPKQLRSKITFDDGRTWQMLRAPEKDVDGKSVSCDTSHTDVCSLHLYSVTSPHNFGRVFSSPAPGFVMGVGSIGSYLKSYEECDTFLSTDAGLTWKMVRKDAHIYEFGDSGSIIVIANDEDGIDSVLYSTDEGKSWREKKLGLTVRSRALVTVPDSTSQKFVMVGQLARKDQNSEGKMAVVSLDFEPTRSRQCGNDDMEKWYARSSKDRECLMGHKQWYWRRKPDADCYVGDKFKDPVEHEENCPCEEQDYECDYNFVRTSDGKCEPRGPEPVPEGVCKGEKEGETFKGSSGYRLIPGNTCDRSKGVKLDTPVEKDCSQAAPPEGKVTHQIFKFPSQAIQQEYFKNSKTILVRLDDHTVWQSSNEGYTWQQLHRGERFLVFYLHPYSSDRGYLITDTKKYYYTTDTGKSWLPMDAPLPTNIFTIPVIYFHPQHSDTLIWHGSSGCENGYGGNCHVEAHYTTNHGRDWDLIDKYVRTCEWARDKDIGANPTQIMCESFKNKKGAQRGFTKDNNPLELVSFTEYNKKKKKLFNSVVGFAKFSEYLVVAEVMSSRDSLDLQVSLDGRTFATGQFPPSMRLDQHSYTILESSTDSLFLHVTTSETAGLWWGNILKSNSNGTYFGTSAEFVNRNENGYVDFEKMIGLDGIALINVVSNAKQATVSGKKEIQSRITHNDGGSWKTLIPPKLDSNGREYKCNTVKCALHVHGYTERFDPRATYSTPSVPGLLMAVGNVGETLAPYTDSDTFLSRDAGFTWQEVHKDAHLWEFGDSGSVLVMANDEVPTDTVLFSTDEGDSWREYKFSNDKYRVRQIMTVPSDTSRRFILFADAPGGASVAIQIDFSSLTKKQCVLNPDDPAHDDFELWSPSEERTERCLFGRQVLYHRRKRDSNCYVGEQTKTQAKLVQNCPCIDSDFECEYNHERVDGKCVLIEGLKPLASTDEVCRGDAEKWYDRTAYRKIAHSSCEGGKRPDRGAEHNCPGLSGHGALFWWTMALIPCGVAAFVGSWWYKTHGPGAGAIRLPGGDGSRTHFYGSSGGNGGVVDTIASVPWYIVGVAGVAFEWVSSKIRQVGQGYRSGGGYRHVPIDEDARVLRFEDED